MKHFPGSKKSILVTGASGFVGRHLCDHLLHCGHSVRAVVRQTMTSVASDRRLSFIGTGDLLHFIDWSNLLRGVDVVVHLVARTHVTDEFGSAAMSEYRRINVDLTRRLARACMRSGVERLVYMSSIKAIGNGSTERIPNRASMNHAECYSEATNCSPVDSYGISKLETEQELIATLDGTDCEFTILRPPLVYGVGVGGNFLRLIQLVDRGLPLPAINNSRSMVHISNLVDATEECASNQLAANQIFHIADPDPISTSELVRSIAIGLGRKSRLVPVPHSFLTGIGRVAGKAELTKRLAGSLVVNSEKIETTLGWTPAVTTKAGVRLTSQSYRRSPWAADKRADKAAAISKAA